MLEWEKSETGKSLPREDNRINTKVNSRSETIENDQGNSYKTMYDW